MVERNDVPDIIGMTGNITVAYVSNNKVDVDELPKIIANIHAALVATGQPADEPIIVSIVRPTASQIRKSITEDALISFENGRRYKSMKRSLTLKGMTPADYREKWGLPADYPMVAPAYAASRSALAKSMGLGAKGRKSNPKAAPPRVRGRRPKGQDGGSV